MKSAWPVDVDAATTRGTSPDRKVGISPLPDGREVPPCGYAKVMFGRRSNVAIPLQQPKLVDYAGLAEALAALSYPLRLELLDLLRIPHSLPDIRLSPHRQAAGENPARAVSKQVVHAHLEKLIDAGLVETESTAQDGRRVNKYTVNVQQFWSVAEGLRRISARYAGRGSIGAETGTMVAGAASNEHQGPRLVLVHGIYEGRTYPLKAKDKAVARWVIGRSRTAGICLDYDPFVSMEHAVVVARSNGYLLEDTSKNGTSVNWSPIARGSPHVLRPGDVIGVGQSLLSFVAG